VSASHQPAPTRPLSLRGKRFLSLENAVAADICIAMAQRCLPRRRLYAVCMFDLYNRVNPICLSSRKVSRTFWWAGTMGWWRSGLSTSATRRNQKNKKNLDRCRIQLDRPFLLLCIGRCQGHSGGPGRRYGGGLVFRHRRHAEAGLRMNSITNSLMF